MKWIVGVSGASGMRYALRTIEVLSANSGEVHVVMSEAALRVLREEENIKVRATKPDHAALFGRELPNLIFHDPRDIGASIASGSMLFDGMVIVPCSMSTLGAIANAMPSNLLQRAADVTIKEGRRLVIVPRETPLSPLHLENMLTLSRIGVRMVPAMPGFYHQPQSINDLVDMMVMKILDQLGVHRDLVKRWGPSEEAGDTGQLPTDLLRFKSLRS